MKKQFDFLRSILWLTQFGLSVCIPPAVCIFGAIWLKNRFLLGGWIIAVGVIVGICASFSCLLSSLKSIKKESENSGFEGSASYNEHK